MLHPLRTKLSLLLSVAALSVACGSSSGGGGLFGDTGAGGDAGGGNGGWGGASSSTGAGGAGGTPAVDNAAPLFTEKSILHFELTLPQESMSALAGAPYEYVKGSLHVELPGETIDLPDIGVRIKGKAGSFRSIDQKSALLLKIDKYNKDQNLLGLKKIALNNMVQDPSMIHERLGYALFHGMDVPSPRAAHATVRVNGQLYGLYTAVESTGNGSFLRRWFGSDKGNLYEGAYGTDLFQGMQGNFEQDKGDDVQFADLTELMQALDSMNNPDTFLTDVAKVIDIEEYLRFAATEIYLGHWDGYAAYRNNYYIYRRPSDKRWVFIPWGIDQTFGEYTDPWVAQGRIQQMCAASLACRKQLAKLYGDVAAQAASLKLAEQAAGLEPFIWEAVLADPRKEVDPGWVSASIASTIDFINKRPADVQSHLGCTDPNNVDEDGDGAFGCGYDCDDHNPAVFPGAPEKCNFADDNCDGIWDNDPSCPQCVVKPAPGGGKHAFCFNPRTWQDAEKDCVAQGGHLADIHNAAMEDALASEASSIDGGTWWIGLSDAKEEGKFVWTNGSPTNYTAWGGGEPNNDGDQDCATLSASSHLWDDFFCDGQLRYICALP